MAAYARMSIYEEGGDLSNNKRRSSKVKVEGQGHLQLAWLMRWTLADLARTVCVGSLVDPPAIEPQTSYGFIAFLHVLFPGFKAVQCHGPMVEVTGKVEVTYIQYGRRLTRQIQEIRLLEAVPQPEVSTKKLWIMPRQQWSIQGGSKRDFCPQPAPSSSLDSSIIEDNIKIKFTDSESIVYIQNSITTLDCQGIKKYVTLREDCEASLAGREERNVRIYLDVGGGAVVTELLTRPDDETRVPVTEGRRSENTRVPVSSGKGTRHRQDSGTRQRLGHPVRKQFACSSGDAFCLRVLLFPHSSSFLCLLSDAVARVTAANVASSLPAVRPVIRGLLDNYFCRKLGEGLPAVRPVIRGLLDNYFCRKLGEGLPAVRPVIRGLLDNYFCRKLGEGLPAVRPVIRGLLDNYFCRKLGEGLPAVRPVIRGLLDNYFCRKLHQRDSTPRSCTLGETIMVLSENEMEAGNIGKELFNYVFRLVLYSCCFTKVHSPLLGEQVSQNRIDQNAEVIMRGDSQWSLSSTVGQAMAFTWQTQHLTYLDLCESRVATSQMFTLSARARPSTSNFARQRGQSLDFAPGARVCRTTGAWRSSRDDYKGDDIKSNQEILTSDNALGDLLCSVVPKDLIQNFISRVWRKFHKSKMSHRFDSQRGSLSDFRTWESFRTMLLAGGFTRVCPVSFTLAFRRGSINTTLTSYFTTYSKQHTIQRTRIKREQWTLVTMYRNFRTWSSMARASGSTKQHRESTISGDSLSPIANNILHTSCLMWVSVSRRNVLRECQLNPWGFILSSSGNLSTGFDIDLDNVISTVQKSRFDAPAQYRFHPGGSERVANMKQNYVATAFAVSSREASMLHVGLAETMNAKRDEYGAALECKGGGKRNIPRKPAVQIHRPARFPRAKIRERSRWQSNPVCLGGRRAV
ncbi:hypothetical protein PR048_011065 [Dryococelus australis]|uniref:Uncharacterized protein n=1 Tax=Dryococelus australis TaxID=614101 RepID=A0ABQ9HKI9_9NEOP|nr:hypothetical protein PR048_011065 [Dryococelus australis]